MNQAKCTTLYRYIPIWFREEGQLSLYRVLEILGVGFVVQSRDFLTEKSTQEELLQLDQQFMELLSETAPEVRMQPQDTIQAAIADFNAESWGGA